MGTRKKRGLAIELDDLGRPARPTVPDPRKIGSNRTISWELRGPNEGLHTHCAQDLIRSDQTV